jgi:hypothetical protein
MDVRGGASNGVNLGGTKAVVALELPGDFITGNGTVRIYVDDRASADQRRELESILSGQQGGMWEALAASMAKALPTRTAPININFGDTPTVSVGGVGEIKLQMLKTSGGRQARLVDAPVAAELGQDSLDLALSEARWSDPEMRAWQVSSGHGGTWDFNLSA